jgi:FkbM family methyltransferase
MNVDLLATLKLAKSAQRENRWVGLAKRPNRIGGPYLLRRLGIEAPRLAETFFGRRQNVVLPDMVSVNIWRYGYFEEDVAFYLLASLRPGGTFIDVGGHFGFFSMLGAELIGADGTVITFEPMPKTREILAGNMAKRSAPCHHHLIPAAAGREAGTLTFKDFGLVGSAFATSEAERSGAFTPPGDVEVAMRPIDQIVGDLALDRLDLIKIDAENAEADVLAGAECTIESLKPALILETGDTEGSEAHPLIESLIERGYRVFEFEDFALKPHIVADRYGYQNLLLVHTERLAEVDGTRG